MREGVAIVGAVQTRYEAAKTGQAYNELVYEVVAELLKQTGIRMQDIHSQVTASQDFYDGKTISSMSVNEVVGGYLKSEAKVAADGIQGMLYGAARILSGKFDYTLVTAHCKESEGDPHAITVAMFDPFVQRPLNCNGTVASALQAQRYMKVTGVTEQDLAQVARRSYHKAMRNPLALRKGDFQLQQILSSPIVAAPLREMMLAPRCDGACALLLASPEKARPFGRRAVWISGMGNATDAYWTDRDLARAEALEVAARRAFGMAAIEQPRKHIHVAEIAARSAHEELLYGQALGLLPGDPRRWLTSPESDDGSLPVLNPSGGALSGNPVSVAGLARVAEAYLQLTGEAGERQVPGAQVALAHGADGICGQAQSVVVLRQGRE